MERREKELLRTSPYILSFPPSLPPSFPPSLTPFLLPFLPPSLLPTVESKHLSHLTKRRLTLPSNALKRRPTPNFLRKNGILDSKFSTTPVALSQWPLLQDLQTWHMSVCVCVHVYVLHLSHELLAYIHIWQTLCFIIHKAVSLSIIFALCFCCSQNGIRCFDYDVAGLT